MVRRGLVGFSEVWSGAVMFSEVRCGREEHNEGRRRGSTPRHCAIKIFSAVM